MLYAVIIVATLFISVGAAVAVSLVTASISLLYAFLAPLFLAVFCGLLLGVLDLVIRLIPSKYWRYDKGIFAVDKREIKFYERLKIRKWKDKAVPELGASAGFSKKKLQSTDAQYLELFLVETCRGEALHALGGVLAFLFLALYPVSDWYFAVPILVVNCVLNLLPCMIQRYNRYRLDVVFKFKSRHAALVACSSGEEMSNENSNNQ